MQGYIRFITLACGTDLAARALTSPLCRPVILDTSCHTLAHIGPVSSVDWQIKPCESTTQELT